jgi:hypothetical protein
MKDIHGNPDIFDSMATLTKEALKNEALKHTASSTEYASQGFEQKQIEELLRIDGCSAEVASELAFSASNNIPSKYDAGEVPLTYNDVKKVVEASILSGNIDDIRKYFDNHARKYSGVITRIIVARSNPTRIFVDEIHSELRPLVEGSILRNIIEAKSQDNISANISEKDSMEMGLFGVWPSFYIKKLASRLKGEDTIIEASKNDYKITYNNTSRKYKKK